jgi:ornithine cyclodeaminase/alanine dehydrogenase-like protein (mu-crystallin family)
MELGAVINGTHVGRSNDAEVTLFDGTGVGLSRFRSDQVRRFKLTVA